MVKEDEPTGSSQQPLRPASEKPDRAREQTTVQPTRLHVPDQAPPPLNDFERAADTPTIGLESQQRESTINFAASPEDSTDSSLDSLPADVTDLWTESNRKQPSVEKFPVVPGYEIKGVLGKGGMGIVYKAIQVSAKREVALKLVLGAAGSQPKVLQRFAVEAQAAARIEHPHVITIYEVSTQGKVPYFSMQFVRGVSLLDLSKQDASMKELARYLAQVARGVQAAHDLGILHRDLKPENILVDLSKKHAYVTDFGLAKPADLDATLTQAGDVFGTPAYMSPEQFRDVASVREASDIYSLGATLYRVISGKVPFEGGTMMKLYEQIQSNVPTSPRVLNPNVSRDLETIVCKCLEKDPAQRYPSMSALARDLEAFIEGEPIAARPISAFRRGTRWIRKHPMAVVSSLFAVIAVVVASIVVPIVMRSRNEGERFKNLRQKELQAQNQIDAAPSEELFDAEFIKGLDTLRSDDQESHLQVVQRLQQRQVRYIGDRLDHPRLSIESLEDLEAKISKLQDSIERQQLEDKLAKRRTNWVVTFERTAPFAKEERWEIMTTGGKYPSYIDVALDRMRLVQEDPAIARTMYRLKAQDAEREQISATFVEDWSSVSRLGLFVAYRIEADGTKMGWFAILSVPPKSLDKDGGKIETIKQAAMAKTDCVLELHEGDQLITSRRISVDELIKNPLAMRLRREGDSLSCYLNQLPPLSIDTIFSTLEGDSGQPGIVWPVGVSVNSIVLEKAELAEGSQPLDEADRKYQEKDFASAIEAYRRVRESARDQQIIDECLFKSALCQANLKDMDSAKATFQELLTQSDSVWAIRSSLQLLYLFQKEKNFQDSRGVVAQIASKFQPSAVRASSSLRLQQDISNLIFDNYLTAKWSQPKDQQERIQMSIEAYDLLDRPLNEKIEARVFLVEKISTVEQARESIKLVVDFAEAVLKDESASAANIIQTTSDAVQLASWIGEPESVQSLLQRARSRVEEIDPMRLHFLLTIQARFALYKGEYDEVLRICDEKLKRVELVRDSFVSNQSFADIAFMRGWALTQLGKTEQANGVWRHGYQMYHAACPNFLSVAMMGSMTDSITPDQTQLMFDKVAEQFQGEIGINFFKQYVPMRLMASATNAMWQSKYGRDMSLRIASGNCSTRCNLTGQLGISVFYFLKQMTRAEEASLDVSEAPEDKDFVTVSESIRLGFETGRIGQSDFIPIGLVYLGSGGIFGFTSLENSKSFSQEEKSVMGYCFACHFIRSKRWSDARKAIKLAEKSTAPTIQELTKLKQAEIPSK